MRFRNIELRNFESDYDGTGTFDIEATNELINEANNIRKRSGFTDFPSANNDVYYNFYLVYNCSERIFDLRFSVSHSLQDDYMDYCIVLLPEEERTIAFIIIQYLAEESIK